jgi:hypothetical protein
MLAYPARLCMYNKYFISFTFLECRLKVDVEPFYDNCIFDICECKGKPECVCNIYSTYAADCASVDTIVNWRPQIKQCGEYFFSVKSMFTVRFYINFNSNYLYLNLNLFFHFFPLDWYEHLALLLRFSTKEIEMRNTILHILTSI